MTNTPGHIDDQEPDAHEDTLLGQSFPGLSEDDGNAIIDEIDRREAAGLPGVPGGDWD